MIRQQFTCVEYHPDKLTQEDKYASLGEIEIKDVCYTIEVDGLIQIRVLTDHPSISQRLKQHVKLKKHDYIINVVDTSDLIVKDKYEIYILKDKEDRTLVELDNLYLMPEQKPESTHVLRWRLVDRYHSAPTEPGTMISIANLPIHCPICSAPVDVNDDTGDLVCTNSECRVSKYQAINRFLSIACKLPQYQKFGRLLLNHGVINDYVDLMDTKKYKLISNFGPRQQARSFIEALASVRGTLGISDWINAHPHLTQSYRVIHKPFPATQFNVPDYLFAKRLDKEFNHRPTEFPHWVEERVLDLAEMDYRDWREICTEDITRYMSLPLFNHITSFVLYDGNDYCMETLDKLSKLKAFKVE